MAEHNRLSFAPVFIKNFDVARIFLTNFDVWHLRISFFVLRFPSNRWRPDVCGGARQRDLPPLSRLTARGLSSDSLRHNMQDLSDRRITRLSVSRLPLLSHLGLPLSW